MDNAIIPAVMNPASSLIVVLHGVCALAYIALTGLILVRPPLSRTGAWLALACVITAAWAAAFVLVWDTPKTQLDGWLEVSRSGAWFGFILHLYRRMVRASEQIDAAFVTLGLLALLIVCGTPVLDLLNAHRAVSLQSLSTDIRLGFAVCNVLLLENLYFNTPSEDRWHINLLCVALGGMFLYDLLLYADGIMFRHLSFALVEGRASATALTAPVLALAIARHRRWAINIHVSRDAAFHSVTLVASGIFLLAIAVIGEAFRHGGSEWGQVMETSLIFSGILALATVVTSGSARSRIRSVIIGNFFSNRYDYRREWMRCIDALAAPQAFVALYDRAIRAAADVVDSPAGALFIRAPQEVSFQWAASWNMPVLNSAVGPGHPLMSVLQGSDRVVHLDEHPAGRLCLPELPQSWLVLPLIHSVRIIGFVVLARPRAHFKLDREAFDLLRIIGREIASRFAEQRATQVLAQTQQLRDYSQRFAFVIHDIKNVSGQLSMLLSNADSYANDPDFQRDILATVRGSVAKVARLLSRLQVVHQEPGSLLVAPAERLRDLIDTVRMTRGTDIILNDQSSDASASIEQDAFDAAAAHLLNNAAEASDPAIPIRVDVRAETDSIVVDITDRGPGMQPEFVRDELFRPFSSTKGGHGIGAYQARELLRCAGADLIVITRPGYGTTMRIILPAVQSSLLEPGSVDA